MKDKRNQYIKVIAEKIVNAEKEIQMGKSVKDNQDKIEKIMRGLSIEDMLKLDAYIQSKKLLS